MSLCVYNFSELIRALSFAIGVRSQGSFDAESFRYRLFADETKPELPLREALGSLSIDLNLDHEPRELLSSARSYETSRPPFPPHVSHRELRTPGD